MSETLALTQALAAGLFLGAMFFGGLWWTVRKGISSPLPGLWFLGSMLLRTSLALAGFSYVTAGEWKNLLACLSGFVVARILVMRLTPAPAQSAAR
ncbi:MAG TPA: ATP synthase subunit I [Bradyrhizobium sp.]|nr:ATP synthase subunit I [Bradyrhizobium sp.]